MVGVNVILVAALEVVAKDAVVIVPSNEPVSEPLNDPVLICTDDDTVPTGSAASTCVELLIVPAGTTAVALIA